MKSRPILFSAPMVRAVLAGTKTQTRRIVKVPGVDYIAGAGADRNDPGNWGYEDDNGDWATLGTNADMHSDYLVRCPYGEPGDRMWVQETWTKLLHTSPATDEPHVCDGDKLIEHATKRANGRWNYDGEVIAYRATSDVEFCDGDGFAGEMANREDMPRWHPSIHMRREHSRIDLEITGVRVERLRQITGPDAHAEGSTYPHPDTFPIEQLAHAHQNATEWYKDLWESINGPGSWDANPWVWVVEFKRVEE